MLQRVEVAFIENDIKDITKVTNIFLPKIINNQLKKIFVEGNLEGELIVPFESDGKFGKDYSFYGKILDASINLSKEFKIKNLNTEIISGKGVQDNGFSLVIKKGLLYDLDLSGSKIYLKRQREKTNVKSSILTNGKLSFTQIKAISSLFNFNVNDFKNINGNAKLKTNINFDFSHKFKIKNFSYSIAGDIFSLEFLSEEKKVIKEYLPKYDPKITLKDTTINLIKSQSNQIIELNGLIKVNDQFDSFKIKEKYNFTKKSHDIKGSLDLTNSKVNISKLNYKKDSGEKSLLIFDINFILNNFYNIKNLDFKSGKTKIILSDIKLNNKFEISNFKNLNIDTFINEIKNNDFVINKSDKITISGNVFDVRPLLESLYKKKKGKKIFSKNFKGNVKVDFKKVLVGENDDVLDFSMIAVINKGSYEKLSLKGNFSEKEIIEMSIYQIDKDKKVLQVISDRARPFVKNFSFIKGFEGGKLEYESFISKNISNSNLKIIDFKVSKVPALAQLLTLASLQGIADTLTGEGISFETFEMISNSKDNILNIDEVLALGPAISILLEGYIDKGKTVSLRGTLVPATKLNSIIASIPVVGDILVGKKAGEGVVGVSFKMKGPPKNIKTTVNPIKTLTPRFIVRAVEKMKRKKKEEVK